MSTLLTLTPNPGVRRFALITAAATLCLLAMGGLVTSHGAGMAVPDWPNTYGYNLFFFPISQWVGGIFYEHTHRLAASMVGLLTCALALWLHGRPARRFMRGAGWILTAAGVGACIMRPARWMDGFVLAITGLALLGGSLVWPRCEPSSKPLRSLGLLAVVAVMLQGVLGGLRVVLFKDQIGILHAVLAQLFFVLLCLIAWLSDPRRVSDDGTASAAVETVPGWLRTVFGVGTLLILAQLVLGATMRHEHAGLAIPDFPLAYGKIWPAMDPASVTLYNQRRLEVVAMNPITAFQIVLQMAHRLTALLVLGTVGLGAWGAWRRLAVSHHVSRISFFWLALVITQALLGAVTIWSNKAADLATAHVVVGALTLATGAWLCCAAWIRVGLPFASVRRDQGLGHEVGWQPSSAISLPGQVAGVGLEPAVERVSTMKS